MSRTTAICRAPAGSVSSVSSMKNPNMAAEADRAKARDDGVMNRIMKRKNTTIGHSRNFPRTGSVMMIMTNHPGEAEVMKTVVKGAVKTTMNIAEKAASVSSSTKVQGQDQHPNPRKDPLLIALRATSNRAMFQ